jgi:outer membrane protein assembly factor BamE (lipoprotein component of BamABCDE complex)
MRITYYIAAVLAMFWCVASCTAEDRQTRRPLPSYKEFVSSHAFPYTAPLKRQQHLKKNYSQLSVGLTQSEVEAALGSPDWIEELYSKSKSPGFLGWSWVYVFEKPDPRLTNLKKDKTIQIVFDPAGRARWIVSNLEGLAGIGGP